MGLPVPGGGAVPRGGATAAAPPRAAISALPFDVDGAGQSGQHFSQRRDRAFHGGAGGGYRVFDDAVDIDLYAVERLIGADDAVFRSNATAGRNAFTGLDVVIVLAAVLIAAGCAWGLSRRLAEYR